MRELKLCVLGLYLLLQFVAPSRVRELKRYHGVESRPQVRVAPSRVRELKHQTCVSHTDKYQVAPSRVRELKHLFFRELLHEVSCRTLTGA